MARSTTRVPGSRKGRQAGLLSGDFSLIKIGASRWDIRDPYHIAVSLSWPAFILGFLAIWLAINLVFAALYVRDPGGISNTRAGSYADVFFFSVETLATVGYGVMAPSTLYCHIVSATEIVTGTAFTAIITGLLFVRFSRPQSRILFAEEAVVTLHNGHPTLMIRVVNSRMTPMTGATARLFVLMSERSAEGHAFRSIHDMALSQSHLPLFVMPWTVMHRIDAESPLHGLDWDKLTHKDLRVFLSIDARDRVLSANIQDLRDYDPSRIRFGMRYVDAVTVDEEGRATADLGRIHMVEPDVAWGGAR